MKKVWIDCDVGVDDALALILAFASRELEIIGITAVNGNVPMNQVFENIQKVLSLIRPASPPLIARGAEKPLKGKTIYAHSVHGIDGLGGADIPKDEKVRFWETSPLLACELLPKMARQISRELTLIATGPLTNLALGVQMDIEGMKNFKEIVMMGGAVRTRGNITPYAEFNIYSDPLAAQIVFESGIPITLVPLDVTHRVFLTPDLMEEKVKSIQNPFSNFLIQATGYDPSIRRFKNRETVFLHDPLAVGVVIDPTIVKMETLPLKVDAHDGEECGRVKEVEIGPKIKVCLEVDVMRFLEIFISSLRGKQ